MFRPTIRHAQKQFVRRTARYCDSPWFRLAVVVMLTCLLLPVPRAGADQSQNHNAHGLPVGVAVDFNQP